MEKETKLSRRAREVMDVIYRLGEASAADILKALPDIPSYSAVRSILRSLQQRGLVKRREEGLRYVYSASEPRTKASLSALQHVLETFFASSPEQTMKALLDLSKKESYEVDFDKFEQLIQDAKREEEA